MLMIHFAQGEDITGLDVEMGELSINQTPFNITSQDIDDSNAQHEDITSLDVQMGVVGGGDITSFDVEVGGGGGGEEDVTSLDVEMGVVGGGGGLYKIIFEPWAKTLVMVPFTITITIVASLWAINGNGQFKLRSFPLHSFFFIVMLNFYMSVIGIIIRHRFPSVARGIYLVSFLCVLLSLTMLFGAILPNLMNVVPWIFLTIVALLVISLVLYENRRC